MENANYRALLATIMALALFLGFLGLCVTFPKVMTILLFITSFCTLAFLIYKIFLNHFKK